MSRPLVAISVQVRKFLVTSAARKGPDADATARGFGQHLPTKGLT